MIQGSIVAMVTPMHDDGSVDNDALERLVEFHIESGTDGIVAVGTTGESATLDEAEHCAVIRRVVQAAAGRVPVIGGTGANATSEALRLTRGAAQAGVDACLLVTPYYNKPTQEGLYQHFALIANSVDIPQILYNVPGRTACDMRPDTVVRLADVENIVGIKEATGEIQRIHELVGRCSSDFAVYSGEDWLSMEAILAGGKGVISVSANVVPAAMHDMCAAALGGDREAAEVFDSRLQPVHKAMFLESNPIPVKWALHDLGYIEAGIRLPLTPLASMHRNAVRSALRSAEAIAA